MSKTTIYNKVVSAINDVGVGNRFHTRTFISSLGLYDFNEKTTVYVYLSTLNKKGYIKNIARGTYKLIKIIPLSERAKYNKPDKKGDLFAEIEISLLIKKYNEGVINIKTIYKIFNGKINKNKFLSDTEEHTEILDRKCFNNTCQLHNKGENICMSTLKFKFCTKRIENALDGPKKST